MNPPRALLAEDEPILSQMLQHLLAQLWPQCQLCSIVDNGNAAVEQALLLRPDILFLDIKMPGRSGLEVVRDLLEEWPDDSAFPLLVFVTAYDEFAVPAFDQAAVDYVLKPVNATRLQQTVERLKLRLHARAAVQPQHDGELARVLAQLRDLVPAALSTPVPERLQVIRAAVGNTIRMIRVADVLYFEATDKYINVVTREHSSLIRSSLRELLPQLDAGIFWQIHRSTVVNSLHIHSAHKDEAGKITLLLRESTEKLPVSRIYAHLFKQM